MAGMDPGALDRRIRLERATVTTSGRGTEQKAWSQLATVWAQQVPQRPIEAWKAGGTAAELETVWRTHWSAQVADLSARDRLRYPATDDGTVYEIIGTPTEIGRREGLEIVTRALA